MPHLGEIISLVVAMSWTVTALFADKASHRLGSMSTNILRLVLAAVFLSLIMWVGAGHPYPVYADGKAYCDKTCGYCRNSYDLAFHFICNTYCTINSYSTR